MCDRNYIIYKKIDGRTKEEHERECIFFFFFFKEIKSTLFCSWNLKNKTNLPYIYGSKVKNKNTKISDNLVINSRATLLLFS